MNVSYGLENNGAVIRKHLQFFLFNHIGKMFQTERNLKSEQCNTPIEISTELKRS